MQKIQLYYLVLTFLNLIPHSLFSMQFSCLAQPLQYSHALELAKTAKSTVDNFLKQNKLSTNDQFEVMKTEDLFLQSNDKLNTAVAVFEYTDIHELTPLTQEQANNICALFKVYHRQQQKNGTWSIMFDFENKALLPTTKRQAALLILVPYLENMKHVKTSANLSFLTPSQLQAVSGVSKDIPAPLASYLQQRDQCKIDLSKGNLIYVYKIKSREPVSAQNQFSASNQKINIINRNLEILHTLEVGQKKVMSETINHHIDELWEMKENEGFAIGTLVKTDSSYQKIEDIKPGQSVIAYDTQNQELTSRKVLHTFNKHVSSYVQITFNDTTIQTAVDQKFYISSIADYVTAEELSKSLELQKAFHIPISDIQLINSEADICALTVEQDHNFFVSEQDVLVHNIVPVIVITAPATVGFAATVVIPAVKITGFAICAWIASKIFGSVIHHPTIDGLPAQGKDKIGKKDSNKKNLADEKPHHTKCGNNAEPKDQNGPSKPKQCIQVGETPKPIGCGNNAEPKDQNGQPKQKQCNQIGGMSKPIGCGNNAKSKDQIDPGKQKQCNHSKGNQPSFEHNKDYKKDDEKDTKSDPELLPKEYIIHTEDTEKQKPNNSNTEKGEKESELSDKPNDKPTQENQGKDLDIPATKQAAQAEVKTDAKEVEAVRQEIFTRQKKVTPDNMKILGCRGQNAPKLREANQTTGRIQLNTESQGGINEAQQLFDDTKKEFASRGIIREGSESLDDGSIRIFSEYKDNSRVQLRTFGKSGHPKVEITDIVRNIKEKITFK